MPVVIKPKKMMVSKDAMKGGGGMDIATRRDALADAFAKAAKKAMTGNKTLSDRDLSRAFAKARGMIGEGMSRGPAKGGVPKRSRSMPSARRKEGMKARKMAKGGTAGGKTKKAMAKGGAAGGKKKMMMMGGGKTKKMMMGGGKTKKMMMGGGKTKKMMRGGGKTKKYMSRGGKAR